MFLEGTMDSIIIIIIIIIIIYFSGKSRKVQLRMRSYEDVTPCMLVDRFKRFRGRFCSSGT